MYIIVYTGTATLYCVLFIGLFLHSQHTGKKRNKFSHSPVQCTLQSSLQRLTFGRYWETLLAESIDLVPKRRVTQTSFQILAYCTIWMRWCVLQPVCRITILTKLYYRKAVFRIVWQHFFYYSYFWNRK